MKVVINSCFGRFNLSEEAYEKLIEWGIPVRKYIEQKRDPVTRLFLDEHANDGLVIFDRLLTPPEEREPIFNSMLRLCGRYWDMWIKKDRTNPLLIRLVEELGEKVNGRCAELKIVEIPDSVEWVISEYDGNETVEEKHRSWN